MAFCWEGEAADSPKRKVDPDAFVVLVQPFSRIDAQRQKLKAEGRLSDQNLPVYRPLVGDLVEVLALSEANQFEVPQRWMLAKLFERGEDKVWDRALLSIGKLSQPIALSPSQAGLTTVTAQNGLAPSVLLYAPLWSQPALAGNGETVVAVVSDGLIVGHTGNPDQMRQLRELVRLGADAQGLLAKRLLVRRGGHWATYP